MFASHLQQPKKSVKRNIQYTQSLILDETIHFTDKHILILQQQQKSNLRRFCIVHYLLNQSSFAMTADWSLWESLNKLCFDLSHRTISRAEKRVLDIVFYLPFLSMLTLSQIWNQNLLRCTIKDLEMLHSYLFQLEYLLIDTNHGPLTIDDRKTVDIAVPVTRLTFFF
ncbi:hypothetical protein CLU79DRAFT_766949 [Phycomyces nitens]|nr:hypothetical protein CLU79DRAFT_766949 [Phycomyces nitens]